MSSAAKKAHVYPHLTNESLLSIGQFCDNGCIAVLTEANVYVMKDDVIIIHGYHNHTDRLWDVKLPHPTSSTHLPTIPSNNSINYVIRKDKAKTELAQYFHATLFPPTISVSTKAIQRENLVTWPGVKNLDFKVTFGGY